MRTIPAKIYNPDRPELGVIEVSRLDADRFHCWQTVVGDATDGYPGARGVGKSDPYVQDIIEADHDELWDLVVSAFNVVGLTEEDAILQARLARILRPEDFNFKTKKVKLWNPEKLVPV